MKILLVGASGFIGTNLVAALRCAGHEVNAVSRRNGVDFTQMLTPEDWLPLIDNIDAVINAVGIIGEQGTQRFAPLHTDAPIALFKACEQSGVRRVIQISALGADHTAFSNFHLSKRKADDLLQTLDLDWFVLRPSLIYGRDGKSTQLFMRLASLARIPVIANGQQRLQPIHISDVVASVLLALTTTDSKQVIDLVGTETFTFVEWLQFMRQAQGLKPARLLRCPFPLAISFTYLARYFNPIFQTENLQMLQRGYRGDCQALQAFLGRAPLSSSAKLLFSDCQTDCYSEGDLS